MGTTIRCSECPLRELAMFQPIADGHRSMLESLRLAQQYKPAGATLISEGQVDAPLFTLFSGWAYRFKTLRDGRRQVLNFLLPGDFVGLQEKVADAALHGVEALTDVWLCPFRRDALWQIHSGAPELGYAITWLAAHEESLIDENLLSVGRRNAAERIATLLLVLYKRAAALLDSVPPEGIEFPLTQQLIADAMGLSLAHTHRTLRVLERMGLHRIRDGRLQIVNPRSLERLADIWADGQPAIRPLI